MASMDSYQTFPANTTKDLDTVRNDVTSFLSDIIQNEEILGLQVFAVNELVENGLEHGYGEVTVGILKTDKYLVVGVTNKGEFDPRGLDSILKENNKKNLKPIKHGRGLLSLPRLKKKKYITEYHLNLDKDPKDPHTELYFLYDLHKEKLLN